MLFGSHVSIRHGYSYAAKAAHVAGCGSFQYFPKNPRSLSIKTFDAHDAMNCADYCKANGLLSIAHTPYPTNFAVDEGTEMADKIMGSLLNDLEIAEACGSIGVVVHFGVYKGKDPLKGYVNIIAFLNRVLRSWNGNTLVLIENQAGQGTKIGITLEELVQIRKLADYPEKIGFCFDTCHAFASGLWTGENWDELVARGEEIDYFSHLKAVHLNDSMFASGSFRDRHADVGQGYIGERRIKKLLQTPLMKRLPLILETPGNILSHSEQIAYLKRLCKES
ncbi:deoxyribonuclease IV [Aneurinibacillus terranovensis]|uniref:deoxyribonuclease IV n=1 Tax=Aneurinibacillus terranovensis TaxID=278991 RepID=UPI0004021E84|nr:deoxyribonuclease IV [Aneurinibacillus terranovensis]